MTSEQDRKVHILQCAAQILKDQTNVDGAVEAELDDIANRIETIAAHLTGIERFSC